MAVDDNGNEIIETVVVENETQKRIKQLSEKVRLTSEERDEKDRLLQDEATKRASAEKERDFYAGFSDALVQYPDAKDFKDDIKSKVLAGYSVEDATIAVLGKAGKLMTQQQQQDEKPGVTGGSAATNLPQGGQVKSPAEMTQAERLDALKEAERRGDLYLS